MPRWVPPWVLAEPRLVPAWAAFLCGQGRGEGFAMTVVGRSRRSPRRFSSPPPPYWVLPSPVSRSETSLGRRSSAVVPPCDRITDAGVAHLAQLTGLTKLDLFMCGRITDAGLAHLAQLTGLTSLDLYGCEDITDAGVEHVQDLTPWCEVWR